MYRTNVIQSYSLSGDPMQFIQRLKQISESNNSLLCIGLDPDIARFTATISRSDTPIFDFNKAIVDATADLVCAYKPQIAHYAAYGAEAELSMTINYIHDTYQIPVILDAKRGDIGSTAEMYAREAFERYNADAVTVNPYLGLDSLEPFLFYEDKGIIILCRTSNPGGSDLQNLRTESGMCLYEHIAIQAKEVWNSNGNVLLVVGATRPRELKRIRELTGDMPFLLPGIGAQGGDIKSSMENARGGQLSVNSARAILYADSSDRFAEGARQVARQTRDEINLFR
jgi:orotidine-5'-phosphate decarboxylase